MSILLDEFNKVISEKINLFGLLYKKNGKFKNFAIGIILEKDVGKEIKNNFFNSLIDFKDANEVPYNISNDLEQKTYEYVYLKEVEQCWNDIITLIDDFYNKDNDNDINMLSHANMFVCYFTYKNYKYYLFTKRDDDSTKLLKGKKILFKNGNFISNLNKDNAFVMLVNVSFAVEINNDDNNQSKILIFNKKDFKDVFNYDECIKKYVNENIFLINQWKFLDSSEQLKEYINKPKVYNRLFKVFKDENYIKQISNVNSNELKSNLIEKCPDVFSNSDFNEDKLVINDSNIDNVMKMLSKGFNFNFFNNLAE